MAVGHTRYGTTGGANRQNCQPMIDEFQAYVWDEQAARRGEEKPVKQLDHAMDALRYFCMTMLPKWRRKE